MRTWLCALWVIAACGPSSTDPRGVRPPSAEPATTLDQVTMGSPQQSCSSDDDCVAGRSHACCGDCAAAPPFVARNRANEAADEAAVMKECETEDHDCSVFSCAPVPPACQFAPRCRDGICAVVSNAACVTDRGRGRRAWLTRRQAGGPGGPHRGGP